MKSFKKLELEIPERLYSDLIKLNIDIEKEVLKSLERLVRCSFLNEDMEKGYQQMGKINLGFAKMCLEADEDALKKTERYFLECE